VKCPLYNCSQHPELRSTGRSEGDPQWICPVCKVEFYERENGEISKTPPKGQKIKKVEIKRWELKSGYWTKD